MADSTSYPDHNENGNVTESASTSKRSSNPTNLTNSSRKVAKKLTVTPHEYDRIKQPWAAKNQADAMEINEEVSTCELNLLNFQFATSGMQWDNNVPDIDTLVQWTLYVDGGCKNNQNGALSGRAGSGCSLWAKYATGENGETMQEQEMWHAVYRATDGQTGGTNNAAEFMAAAIALWRLDSMGIRGKNIIVRGDSKLMISSLKGDLTLNNETLVHLHRIQKDAIARMRARGLEVMFEWVPRLNNTRADELSNLAMMESLNISFEVFNGRWGYDVANFNHAITLSNYNSFRHTHLNHCVPVAPYQGPMLPIVLATPTSRDLSEGVYVEFEETELPLGGSSDVRTADSDNSRLQNTSSPSRGPLSEITVIELEINARRQTCHSLGNVIWNTWVPQSGRTAEDPLNAISQDCQRGLKLIVPSNTEANYLADQLIRTVLDEVYPDNHITSRHQSLENAIKTWPALQSLRYQYHIRIPVEDLETIRLINAALNNSGFYLHNTDQPTRDQYFVRTISGSEASTTHGHLSLSQLQEVISFLPAPPVAMDDGRLQSTITPSSEGYYFSQCLSLMIGNIWKHTMDFLHACRISGEGIYLGNGDATNCEIWRRCYYCPSFCFKSSQQAMSHIRRHHLRVPVDSLVPHRLQAINPYRSCPTCNQITLGPRGLRMHQVTCRPTDRLMADVQNADIDLRQDPEDLLQGPIFQSCESLSEAPDDLVAAYCFPLSKVNRNWLPLLPDALTRLLNDSMDDRFKSRQDINFMAFLLLPGLLAFLLKARHHSTDSARHFDFREGGSPSGFPTPVNFLRALTAERFSADKIITCALNWLPDVKVLLGTKKPRTQEKASNEQLVKRATHAAATRKIAQAAAAIQELGQNILSVHVDNDDEAATQQREHSKDISMAEIRGRVNALHPPSSSRDILPDVPEGTKCIQILPREVYDTISRGIKIGASAGFTGYTYALLHALLTKSPGPQRIAFRDALTKLFNRVLAGKASECMRDMWMQVREILVPKPGTDKMRPIGIGCAVMRLMEKCVQRKINKRVSAKLLEVGQLMGTSRGCELMARTAQGYFDLGVDGSRRLAFGHAVLELDTENAFNSMPRGLIMQEILQVCPEVAALYKWGNNKGVKLRWSNGDQIGVMSTGTVQGGPLSMTYFSLGQMPLCRDLNAQLKQAESDYVKTYTDTDLYPGKVLFVADDACICGYGPVVCNTALAANDIYAKYGLKLVPTKSVLLMPNLDICPEAITLQVDNNFPGRTDGITLVGCPIGSHAYRAQQFHDTVQRTKPVPAAFEMLSPRVGYIVLQLSIAHQLTYLLSTLEFENCIIPEAAKDFDRAMDETLATIAKISEEHPYLSTLRSLPSSMGGLGLKYYYSEYTEGNRIRSRNAFYHFVNKFVPVLEPLLMSQNYWQPIRIGEHAEPGMYNIALKNTKKSFLQLNALKDPIPDVRTHVESLLTAISRARQEIFMNKLRGNPNTIDEAVLLRSAATSGTGAPLFDLIGLAKTDWDHLRDDDFQLFLQRRLLASPQLPAAAPDRPVWCCCGDNSAGMGIDLRIHRFHDRSCRVCGPLRTQCHNEILERLRQYVASILPDAHIRTEPRLIETTQQEAALEEEYRPDIQIMHHGAVLFTDVSIVDPTVSTYISVHKSDSIEGAACAAKEKQKMAKYGQRCQNNFTTGQFIPFVMESTGRLGNSARQFLKAVAKLSRDLPSDTGGEALGCEDDMHETGVTDQERFVIHDIVVINAKYGSRMTKRVLNHLYRRQSRRTLGEPPLRD